MVQDFTFSEIGDSLTIENKFPVWNIDSILTYTDVTVGETATRYFDRYFQYSVDNGITYSEWIILSIENLTSIDIKSSQIFYLNIRYIRSGSDTTDLLEFKSIDFTCTTSNTLDPDKFKNFTFNTLNSYISINNLKWTSNVLNKIYDKSFVASYLNRGDNSNWSDQDYIDFWWTVIHNSALLVDFNKSIGDVLFNKDLLYDYLQQKGITPDQTKDLDKLTFIVTNFYNEIRRRGSLGIIQEKNENTLVNGELFRLIDKRPLDEFIFCLCENDRAGWTLNRSSPMYKGLEGITNIIKGYEKTRDVIDITKYPTIGAPSVTQDSDKSVMLITQAVKGIEDVISGGISTNIEKLILVDVNVDYEISLCVNKGDLSVIDFGIKTYNSHGVLIEDGTISAKDFTDQSYFIDSGMIYAIQGYQRVRAILRNKNHSGVDNSAIFNSEGQNLRFKDSRVKYISLIFKQTAGTSDTRLYDIKIRPLKTTFSRGFLHISNLILMLYINRNRESSNSVVECFIKEYLLPYNSKLLTKEISK